MEIREPVFQQPEAQRHWVSPRSVFLKNVRQKARESPSRGPASPTPLPLRDLLRKPLSVLKSQVGGADSRFVAPAHPFSVDLTRCAHLSVCRPACARESESKKEQEQERVRASESGTNALTTLLSLTHQGQDAGCHRPYCR